MAKVWELQLQHQSFQYIFRSDFLFRIDWFDLLAVQGTLKSLLQYHSSKASVLLCSAFFMVYLSYPHVITGETIYLVVLSVLLWNLEAFTGLDFGFLSKSSPH